MGTGAGCGESCNALLREGQHIVCLPGSSHHEASVSEWMLYSAQE